MTTMKLVESYAARGWAVFPVGRDKRPRCKWRATSSTDPDLIRNGHNVAIDCGKSGLVVLDLDIKGDDDGLAAWKALRDKLGIDEAQALVTETPSGGRHLIWKDPTGGLIGNSTGQLPAGIDVRGNGGYIVAPPSVTPEGPYRWIQDGDPQSLPPELVKLLLEKPEPDPPPIGGGQAVAGDRQAAYIEAILQRETEAVASTPAHCGPYGGRNGQLNASAFALGQRVGAGLLSRSDAEAALYDAAASCGLVADDGEKAVNATIRSGLDAGERDPKRIPPPQRPTGPQTAAQSPAKPGSAQKRGQKLDTWPYATKNGRIVLLSRDSKGNLRDKPVCDFEARITHQVTTEYGDRVFRLAGRAVAGGDFTAEIDAGDYEETRKLVSALGGAAGALDPVRTGMRRHLGPAIKLLSRGSRIKNLKRFERVGWHGKRYLIPGRLDPGIEVKTDPDLPFEVDQKADLSKGLEALEHLLGAFDPAVTAPVIGYTLLPPIARVAGLHNERFGLFVVGRTGALKTSYMQATLACWGAGFTDDTTLVKWGEGTTRNAAMALATQATDAPMLIDNFKPGTGEGTSGFINLWHNILEGGEKRRLDRTSKLKETKPIWAWPIATGEQVPSDDAATLARMLVIPFAWPRGQDNPELAKAQALAPHLSAILRELLDWLEGRGREWAVLLASSFVDKRQEWARRMLAVETEAINARRMGSSLATLEIGWTILGEHPALGDVFKAHNPGFLRGLEDIATWQATHSLEALEARQFLDGLRKLLDSGRLWLAPDRDLGTQQAQDERRGFAGWQDGQGGAYVLPDAITLVKQLLGTRLNGVSDRVIYEQLAEIGALVGTTGNRNTYRVRVGPGRTERPRALWLSEEALAG